MRSRRLFALAALPALAIIGGCGDVAYQSRTLPRASELTWETELKQLPWKPPALGDVHYPRAGAETYQPGPGPEIIGDQDTGHLRTHWTSRH